MNNPIRYYHMIVERLASFGDDPEDRRTYISTHQGAAPPGWRCVAVCGFHEVPRPPQNSPKKRPRKD